MLGRYINNGITLAIFGKFISISIKTACMLGIQMIDRIEYVHNRKIIHRDIKPDNFVIG